MQRWPEAEQRIGGGVGRRSAGVKRQRTVTRRGTLVASEANKRLLNDLPLADCMTADSIRTA